MRKSFVTFSWIIGLISFLFILTLIAQPGSLNQYYSSYFDFLYPDSWQLSEMSLTRPGVFSVGNTPPGKPLEPFTDDKNLIQFSFPAKWLVQQESFTGSEIIKHVQLISPDQKNVCFIQIWQSFKPLTEFINDIEKAPIKGEGISDFVVSDTKINGYKGYLVTYKYKEILCKEVYFMYQKRIYRIAYLYSGPKWTKEQEGIFQTILQSIIIKSD